MPVVHKQSSSPFVMPVLQELVSVERTGLMFGAAYAAAATCSAWRYLKQQRRRRPLNRVAVAQQMSDTSLPSRRYVWDQRADAVQKQHGKRFRGQQIRAVQESWRHFLQELRTLSAQTSVCCGKSFQWLSNNNSKHFAEREVLWLIARQRAITKDYLDQVAMHVSNRSCVLEQLHVELERAASRNAALLERLKRAEERKQILDKTAQVLIDDHDELLREEASTSHMTRSTHCSKALLEKMESTDALGDCPELCSEEQRGSTHTSVSMDHVYISDSFRPHSSDNSVSWARMRDLCPSASSI